jgi:hypothetical protein
LPIVELLLEAIYRTREAFERRRRYRKGFEGERARRAGDEVDLGRAG